MNIEDIISTIHSNRIRITDHADEETQDDQLSYDEIFVSVLRGEVIEDYPDDWPYPSCLSNFVAEIFEIAHFQMLVRKKERLQGNPVADPFVIAKAQALEEGCVVPQEIYKPHAAKIPNVCEHFDIPCLNLEAFMENAKWRF